MRVHEQIGNYSRPTGTGYRQSQKVLKFGILPNNIYIFA